MNKRLFVLVLGTLVAGVACAPSPPDAAIERFANGAALCLDGEEVRAVFDSCASSCSQVLEGSCSIAEGTVETLYEIETTEGDCTADCRLHDASCGTVEAETLTYGGDDVVVADLPGCGELF